MGRNVIVGGQTKNDYLRQLIGSYYKPGMTQHDMLFILAGPTANVTDSLRDLFRKWAGNPLEFPGYDSWDYLRLILGPLFKPGQTMNDMLRVLVSQYPEGLFDAPLLPVLTIPSISYSSVTHIVSGAVSKSEQSGEPSQWEFAVLSGSYSSAPDQTDSWATATYFEAGSSGENYWNTAMSGVSNTSAFVRYKFEGVWSPWSVGITD